MIKHIILIGICVTVGFMGAAFSFGVLTGQQESPLELLSATMHIAPSAQPKQAEPNIQEISPKTLLREPAEGREPAEALPLESQETHVTEGAVQEVPEKKKSIVSDILNFGFRKIPEQKASTKPSEAAVRFAASASQKHVTASKPLPPLACTGILYTSDKEGMALINDYILKEGDEILGAKIIKITSRQVTVRYDGRDYDLRVK